MNINIVRLTPVVNALKRIEMQLERLADCWEMELAQQGVNMRPPKADTTGPAPTVSFTDEEEMFIRESEERLRREDQRKMDEEENQT